MNYLLHVVWETLRGLIDPNSVLALWTLGKSGMLQLTTKDTISKMRLVQIGQIEVHGRIGRIRSVIDHNVAVRVYWLPAWVDDGVLKELLSSYGMVYSVEVNSICART
jgi:hypothetical protein